MSRFLKLASVCMLGWPVLAVATTCEQAQWVQSLPYQANVVDSGTNDIRADNAENCVSSLYYGGNEALLRFTPKVSGTMTLLYEGQTWTALVVYAGCPTSGASCVGGVADHTHIKQLSVEVEADQEYFILVDTWPMPPSPVPGVITIDGPSLPDGVFFDRFEMIPNP